VVIRSQEILTQFEELYRASVNNLYESYRLLMQSKQLGSNERRVLLDERERLLKEIQVSVDFSFTALEQYRNFYEKDRRYRT
jgi:hypothetical protein